jgi:hypothetical protein
MSHQAKNNSDFYVVGGTLRFDKPDAPPIQGDPEELLKEWQKKLALKLDEKTGKIEPFYQ